MAYEPKPVTPGDTAPLPPTPVEPRQEPAAPPKPGEKPLAMKYLMELFEEYDKERRQREPAWNRWSAAFRGVFFGHKGRAAEDGTHGKKVEEDFKSRLFVNQTKNVIVTAVSNVMSILFQRTPPFTVIGFGTNLNEEVSKLIQQVVWFFMTMSRFQIKARKYVTQCAIYGTTFAKVFMDKVQHTNIGIEPTLSELDKTPLGFERKVVVSELPFVKWDTVDIYDIWDDQAVNDHTDWGRGLFHRVFRSEHYVKFKIDRGLFRNIDISKYTKQSPADGRDLRRSIIGLNPIKRGDLQLFEFWGKLPPDEAKSVGIEAAPEEWEVPAYCLMIGTGGKPEDYLLARRNSNPGHFIPFVRDIWEDTGEGPSGRGIPENVQGPQTALNVTINTRLDNKATAIQQIIGVVMDAIEDPDDLKFKQNWVIRFKEGMGDIRQKLMALNVPDITQNAYLEAKEFERMIEEQSGIVKYVQGTESYGSNRTAGGIATVYQAASKFIRDISSQIELNLIGDSARLIYKMALSYMPNEFLILLTDEPMAPVYRQVALDKMAMDVDFIPMGVQGLGMKEIETSQMVQFATATNNPIDLQITGMDGRRELLHTIITNLGWRNADKIIPKQPTTPAMPQVPGQGLTLPEGGQPGAGAPPATIEGVLQGLPR